MCVCSGSEATEKSVQKERERDRQSECVFV